MWTSWYAGSAGGFDSPTDVGVSPDGSAVFVIGLSNAVGIEGDWATAAYDAATGKKLWLAPYTGRRSGYDAPQALAVSPDGSTVFVVGYTQDVIEEDNFTTVAYDAATGHQLWLTEYDAAGFFDSAIDVAVSIDGLKVFVTGASDGGQPHFNWDYATVSYDASSGAQLWVARYDGPSDFYDYPYAIASSPDGSTVLVTGTSQAPESDQDYLTVAYDADSGTQLWVARYSGPGNEINDLDYGRAMSTSRDGSAVFVTGYSQATDSNYDYATVAYDAATGTELWVTRYNGPGNDQDNAEALGMSPDGSAVFVTGWSDGGDSKFDYATIAYDAATGTELWVARYAGPFNDYAFDLGVDPSGSAVYVTGDRRSRQDRLDDFLTLAYDAHTGYRLWRSRNGGRLSDLVAALVVSPDGASLFVTGAHYEDDATTNWATISLAT